MGEFARFRAPLSDFFLGVALKQVGEDQFHTGVVYREGLPGETRLFDLAWHRDLRLRELDLDTYGVAILWFNGYPLPPARIRGVAGMIRRIHRQCGDGQIPYSFSLSSAFDDQTGELIEGSDDAPGFTCATFVLAVLRAAGFELLADDWPQRSEDEAWQKHMLRHLRAEAAPEHITGLEEQLGNIRYRPSEVAGGALKDEHPAEYPDIEELAANLRSLVAEQNN